MNETRAVSAEVPYALLIIPYTCPQNVKVVLRCHAHIIYSPVRRSSLHEEDLFLLSVKRERGFKLLQVQLEHGSWATVLLPVSDSTVGWWFWTSFDRVRS